MISAAVWIVVKVSVLLGVAALAQGVMRRPASAATRHLVWTLALFTTLALPVLTLVLPEWAVVRTVSPARLEATPIATPVDETVAPARPSSFLASAADVTPAPTAANIDSTTAVLVVLYLAGALVVLIDLALHRRAVRRLVNQATEV